MEILAVCETSVNIQGWGLVVLGGGGGADPDCYTQDWLALLGKKM